MPGTKLAAKVMENVHEGIWVTDRKGEMIIANPSFLRITGYTTEEIVASGFPLICGPESSRVLAKSIRTHVRETGCWRGELTLERKGGAKFPAMLTVSSLTDDDGEIVNFVGVLDDVAERKWIEESRALELGRAKQIYDLAVQPKLQAVEGARINVECFPAEYIGGDIVQMSKLDAKRLMVFLADVTGHGVPAAMTANSIKMLIKEISLTSTDPGAVCTRLNEAICGNILPDDLVAGFCGLFDLEAMKLTYCLAGLPLPVISRCGEGIRLRPTGPPLGVFGGLTYHFDTVPLVAGDLFLAFTDGITEARDASGTLFGSSGVQGSIAGMTGDVYAVARKLMGDVTQFQRSSLFSDDVILMGVEICPGKTDPLGFHAGAWGRFSTNAKCVFSARTKDIHLDGMIEMVMQSVSDRCRLAPEEFGKIRVALFELLSNAIEHGHLEMTAMKRNPALYDTEEYWKIYHDRLNGARYGEKQVVIECVFKDNEVLISIEDEGKGFDVETVADPTRDENLENFSGRGIQIAEMAVDKLTYNRKGNRVTIAKTIGEHIHLRADTGSGTRASSKSPG